MFEEKPDYNYLRGLFRGLLERSGYQADGKYDWVLKKEGGQQQLQQQIQQEERKAPLPRTGGQMMRQNSKNLQEERKEARANAGAQILAGGRNTGRPPMQGGLNQFANAPQYKANNNVA